MPLLVDTSILIQAERRGLSPRHLGIDPGEDVAMSSLTVSELLFGLHKAQTAARREGRQAFIDMAVESIQVLPFDLVAAEIHARIWATLESLGQRIGPHDTIIAATALAHNRAILTANVREFSRVPGLEVVQPAW
jgi:tRNA(fMet)-specific endonuclease VapC